MCQSGKSSERARRTSHTFSVGIADRTGTTFCEREERVVYTVGCERHAGGDDELCGWGGGGDSPTIKECGCST